MSTKEVISLLNKWKCPTEDSATATMHSSISESPVNVGLSTLEKPKFQLEILGGWQAPGNKRAPPRRGKCLIHHINTPCALTSPRAEHPTDYLQTSPRMLLTMPGQCPIPAG